MDKEIRDMIKYAKNMKIEDKLKIIKNILSTDPMSEPGYLSTINPDVYIDGWKKEFGDNSK